MEFQNLSNLVIETVTIITGHNLRHSTLGQNKELIDLLDNYSSLADLVNNSNVFDFAGWRILKRNSSVYQSSRICHECIAIKIK